MTSTEHLQQLHTVRTELDRLERLITEPITSNGGAALPAWLRVTRGESHWPVVAMIAVAIGLQLALPDRLLPPHWWLLPGIEVVLLVALVVANPRRFDRESRALRLGSLTLTGVLSVANGWSAALLAASMITGQGGSEAGPLLAAGAAIWLTNVIAFALWYWQFDRGGPAARALARKRNPDFLFAQMGNPDLVDPNWEPQLLDYLYVSFTNATAFSPADPPLSRWAKLTTLTQALISLVTVALILARAVGVLR